MKEKERLSWRKSAKAHFLAWMLRWNIRSVLPVFFVITVLSVLLAISFLMEINKLQTIVRLMFSEAELWEILLKLRGLLFLFIIKYIFKLVIKKYHTQTLSQLSTNFSSNVTTNLTLLQVQGVQDKSEKSSAKIRRQIRRISSLFIQQASELLPDFFVFIGCIYFLTQINLLLFAGASFGFLIGWYLSCETQDWRTLNQQPEEILGIKKQQKKKRRLERVLQAISSKDQQMCQTLLKISRGAFLSACVSMIVVAVILYGWQGVLLEELFLFFLVCLFSSQPLFQLIQCLFRLDNAQDGMREIFDFHVKNHRQNLS